MVGMKGSAHPNTRLTEDIIQLICRSQESSDILAARYEVSRGTISGIRSGRTWKHVNRPIIKQTFNAPKEDIPDVELAYMAGMVDGEGSITIGSRNSKQNESEYLVSHTRVAVYNCHLGVLEWIKERFGGYICEAPRDLSRRKKAYSWTVGHRGAALVLDMILPFLIIKQQQARLLLEFSGTRKRYGAKRVPQDILIRRVEIAGELRALNKRGPNALAL